MSEGMGAVASGVSAPNPATQSTSSSKAASKAAINQPAQKTAEKPAQTVPVPDFKGTKHRVKVDGREVEVDYDDLVNDYQLKQASFDRFKQASEKEKQAHAFEKAIETGDYKTFESKFGKEKLKEWMENYLISDLEQEELKRSNPSEFRARQLERQLKEREEQEARQKQEQEAQRQEEIRAKAHQELDVEISEALKGLGKKPTPRLAARIVDEMLIRFEGKKTKISAADASKLAFKSIEADIAEYLPSLPVEKLRQVIPPQVIDLLRKDEVDKVMTQRSTRRVKAPETDNSRAERPPNNIDTWFQKREKQLKRRG